MRAFFFPGAVWGKSAIRPDSAYEDWLTAPADTTRDFLVPFPADRLVATPMEK